MPWTDITALALVYVIAVWAFFTGALEILAAAQLRRGIPGERLLGLSGVLSVTLGVLLVLAPASGAIALVWVIGAYAMAFGFVLTALGIMLRRQRALETRRETMEAA